MHNTNQFPTAEAIQNELVREKTKSRFRRMLKNSIYTLIVVAAIAVLIATLVMPVLEISGTSMEPTLNNGEIVVLFKTSSLDRGDLCGFSYSNKVLVKRVIGLPGDVIEVQNDGTVYVNDVKLDEPYLTDKGLGECDIDFPFTVPENTYFVLGDQRSTSIDSRHTVIGCIEQDQIIGRILFRIWPITEFTLF